MFLASSIIEEVRTWITMLLAAVLSFLAPLRGDLSIMLLLFFFNWLVGLVADITNGGHWSNKKTWQAIKEAGLFFALTCFVYIIGALKEQPGQTMQVVSFITYSYLYFYGTNICRNLTKLFPKRSVGYKVVNWFYWILSVEFIKKLPFMVKYLQGRSPVEAVEEAAAEAEVPADGWDAEPAEDDGAAEVTEGHREP